MLPAASNSAIVAGNRLPGMADCWSDGSTRINHKGP